MTPCQESRGRPDRARSSLGLRDDYYRLFMADYRKALSNLDPAVLVELLQVAWPQMVESFFDLSVRYSPAINAGLSEEKIGALADSSGFRRCSPTVSGPRWSSPSNAVIQSSSITDEDVQRLLTVLSPEEFIYFCKALSVMDQFARANAIFAIEPSDAVPATMPTLRSH